VLDSLPSRLGLDFDLSAVASGIYGFLLMIIMLLRPGGLLPERGLTTTTRRWTGG
jgi:branched-chain amino acid transport system permease protein